MQTTTAGQHTPQARTAAALADGLWLLDGSAERSELALNEFVGLGEEGWEHLVHDEETTVLNNDVLQKHATERATKSEKEHRERRRNSVKQATGKGATERATNKGKEHREQRTEKK